jgi:heparan-alpha-glucosaminide N-acetyltransferase
MNSSTAAPPPAGAVSSASNPGAFPAGRLGSIDVYRGLVMFLMIGELFHFGRVARELHAAGSPSGFWDFLAHHQEHVDWVGCVLHDMIQPSFSFLVGVALPFSIASRLAKGQAPIRMWGHAVWRALILVLLGVFLRSTGTDHTNWTLEDTLSQIGLGYPILFALGFAKPRVQWIGLAVVLVGYWLAFALYPVPTDFDYASVGVSADWLKEHGLTGFAAHWQKNSNLAWAADTRILNWFPRPGLWRFNGGGYATLSFIPTLGTMLLGLIAGGVIRGERTPMAKVRWFVAAGCVALVAGWALGALGICPVVKRIWTPSWTLFSGGWCFLLLAGFYFVVDVVGMKKWAFALRVIGVNSIAAYLIAHLWDGFISRNLSTHLGRNLFSFAGAPYESFFHGTATFLVIWLILFWMERRKLFLRI